MLCLQSSMAHTCCFSLPYISSRVQAVRPASGGDVYSYPDFIVMSPCPLPQSQETVALPHSRENLPSPDEVHAAVGSPKSTSHSVARGGSGEAPPPCIALPVQPYQE